MPTINVTNLTSAVLALPGGFYTSPVAPGATVSFDVPDFDEFIGRVAIRNLLVAGSIGVLNSALDAEVRPVPTYTTAQLAGTVTPTLFPTGTVVYDSTRMSPVVDALDIATGLVDSWQPQITVIAGTSAALAALIALGNVPTNALAFNTDTATLVRNNGTAFVSCNLSTVITSQAGLPANPHVDGQLTYNETTQSLLVCTTAGAPGTWDTVFVAPTGTTVAPPAEAATVTGGAYFNTTTNRLSFRVGANWLHLPVAHYDTAANIAAVAGAGKYIGEFGWASDTNRIEICAVDTTPGPAVWYNETTVGMYAPAAGHAYNGAVIFDGTDFINTTLGQGTLRVYSGAAVAWLAPQTVVPIVPQVADLPAVADVPVGYMVLVNAGVGVPGTTLYTKIGAAWVTGL